MSVVPGVARKAPPRRAPEGAGLSRDKIVAASMKLIDEQGLEAFSLRAVAKALGVYPTALYWHVPSRNELVVEIITDVLAEMMPPRELAWEPWLRELLQRYRSIIRRHPNVAPLIGVQLVSNASVDLTLLETTLEKLHEAGFEGERLVAAYNAVFGTLVGFVTQEFAMVLTDDVDSWTARMGDLVARIDPQTHPMLAAHKELMLNRSFILRWQNGAAAPLDAGFEFYCELLVAGLKGLAASAGGGSTRQMLT